MMIIPTKEQRVMMDAIYPWMRWDENYGRVLRDDAPDKIKEYYQKLRELYKDADKFS